MGLFHASVHIWFVSPSGTILLQKRGANKLTYPLFWDVSVAGHVAAGETIEHAAVREVEEEIGLTIVQEDLHKIGVFKSVHEHSNGIIDREFHHAFICWLHLPITDLKKQETEVDALRLETLAEFSTATKNTKVMNYVPHGTSYYTHIVMAAQALIKSH